MKLIKSFLISIFIILTLFTGAKAEYFSDIILTGTQGVWVDARSYSSINAAVTAIGANDRELVIVSPQTTTNLTIPSNVRLRFIRNGSITNSSQLTINTKNIIADNRQIFTGVGNIDFAPGTVLRSAWFSNIETAFALTINDTVTLIISKPQTITASYSPGNNVTLKWEAAGNILTTNAGVTVSNIRRIESGNYQLFAGAGTFTFVDGTKLNLSWFLHLRSALTWISTNKVTLVVPGTNVVDYSDTVPSNISFDMESEKGIFNISPGITLTINNPSMLGLSDRQIFTGTGLVSFTNSGTVYASWFGTTHTSITLALTSIGTTNKSILLFTSLTWTIGANVDWSAYTNTIFKILPDTMLSHDAFTMKIPNPTTAELRFQWLTGPGQVTFNGVVPEVMAEWFGALPATLTTFPDSYAALVKACASKLYKVRVTLGEGVFLTSDTLTLAYAGTVPLVELEGVHIFNTFIHHIGAQVTGCIYNTGGMNLKNISIGSISGPALNSHVASQMHIENLGLSSAGSNYPYIYWSEGSGAVVANHITDWLGAGADVQAIMTAAGATRVPAKYGIFFETIAAANPWEFWLYNLRLQYHTHAAIKTRGFPGQIHIIHGKLNGGSTDGRVFDLDGGEIFLEHGFSETAGGTPLTESVYIDNAVGNTIFNCDDWFFQTQDINVQNSGAFKIKLNIQGSTFKLLTIAATTNIEEIRIIDCDVTTTITDPFSQTLNASTDNKFIYSNWHVNSATGLKVPIGYEKFMLGSSVEAGPQFGIVRRNGPTGSGPSKMRFLTSRGTHVAPLDSSDGDGINDIEWFARYTTDKIFAAIIASVVDSSNQQGILGFQFSPAGANNLYFTFSDKGMYLLPIAAVDASNGTIYVSSADGKLYFKNAAGVSNALY